MMRQRETDTEMNHKSICDIKNARATIQFSIIQIRWTSAQRYGDTRTRYVLTILFTYFSFAFFSFTLHFCILCKYKHDRHTFAYGRSPRGSAMLNVWKGYGKLYRTNLIMERLSCHPDSHIRPNIHLGRNQMTCLDLGISFSTED